MIVCIDSGNSRIKWAVHAAGQWLASGALAHAEVGDLARLAERWPNPVRVMLANVAGHDAAQRIRAQLPGWQAVWCEVKAAAAACGVSNLYQNPEQLGVDRWCALIGARHLVSGAAIVVMAGTATTIDTLDGDGNFQGGLILPGIDLMRRSLAGGTADLPLAEGHYSTLPRCTADAIVSGVLEAQLGAIERAYARLPVGDNCCVISGGNADFIGSRLVIPHIVVHNLPARGLLQLSQNNQDCLTGIRDGDCCNRSAENRDVCRPA